METATVGTAIKEWVLYAWMYQILLACVIGAAVGYVARKLLYLAERKFVS
jgi:sodium/hydrogen antiporter